MIPLHDSLPLIRYNRRLTIELDERWVTESIFEAAAQTGRSRWWAEQITSGLLLFLEHDVREQEVDRTFLEDSVRIILQKLNAPDVCPHFRLLPPRAIVSLESLAEHSGPVPCELHFYRELRHTLTERIEDGIQSIHLCDLRNAVKFLHGTNSWRKKCHETKNDILHIISQQACKSATSRRLNIVIS